MRISLLEILIFWVFFLYGIISFFQKVLYEFRAIRKRKKFKGKFVLIVQNQETSIEVVLRVLSHLGIEVEVLDGRSIDDTRKIIEKLSFDLDGVHFIDEELNILKID